MTQFNTDEMDAGIAEIFSMKTPVGRQAKIASMLQELADKPEVKLSDRLSEDLGLDSLTIFEMGLQLEELTDHEFTDEDLQKLKTVQDVFTMVETKYAGTK